MYHTRCFSRDGLPRRNSWWPLNTAGPSAGRGNSQTAAAGQSEPQTVTATDLQRHFASIQPLLEPRQLSMLFEQLSVQLTMTMNTAGIRERLQCVPNSSFVITPSLTQGTCNCWHPSLPQSEPCLTCQYSRTCNPFCDTPLTTQQHI